MQAAPPEQVGDYPPVCKKAKTSSKEIAILKRPAAPTKFGRCVRCGFAMQLVPPGLDGRPMVGCSRYRGGKGECAGYLRSVRPDEEHFLPSRFVVKVRKHA